MLLLVGSVSLPGFTRNDLVWWFRITAFDPIRVFVFGWTLLGLVVVARHRRPTSKLFSAICWANSCAAVLMLLSLLMGGKVVD